LIFTAERVGRTPQRRGLKLNYPEARPDQRRRHGGATARPWRTSEGRTIPSRADDGRHAEMIPDIQVEATFPTAPNWSLCTSPLFEHPSF
jgi:urease gamma subunit